MEDIFNMISAYLPAGYIIICLGLIVVGEMLKKFTVLPNQLLTTALPILGAFATGISYANSVEAFEMASLIQQICLGLLLGWAATGGFEWFKNTFVNKTTITKVINEVEKIVEQLPDEQSESEQVETNTEETNEG